MLIVYEAILRLHPQAIHAGSVIVVAVAATIINLFAARVLEDHSHDLNMRAALLHMTADALTSAGVAVAAIVIATTGGNDWLDPVVSLVIALVIAVRAVQLLGAATSVLLESTPHDVDPAELVAAMTSVPGVEAVHDLHTWSLSSDYRALSAHIVLEGEPSLAAQRTTDEVKQLIASRFGIAHTTLEPEARHCDPDELDPCRSEPRVGRGLTAYRGHRGDHRQDDEHHGHAAMQHGDVDEPHEALTADDGDQRDRPQGEQGTETDRERRVVVRGEVGREDLREVTPLRDEDHDERGRSTAATGQDLAIDERDLVVGILAKGEDRTDEEHHRHDRFEHAMRDQMEEPDADGRGDDDMHQEGARGTQPHGSWVPA